MKTAIVYYSMGGNTEFAARELLSAGLDADLIEIRPEKAYPDNNVINLISQGARAHRRKRPKMLSYNLIHLNSVSEAYGRHT